jgi:hypothetical protein
VADGIGIDLDLLEGLHSRLRDHASQLETASVVSIADAGRSTNELRAAVASLDAARARAAAILAEVADAAAASAAAYRAQDDAVATAFAG